MWKSHRGRGRRGEMLGKGTKLSLASGPHNGALVESRARGAQRRGSWRRTSLPPHRQVLVLLDVKHDLQAVASPAFHGLQPRPPILTRVECVTLPIPGEDLVEGRVESVRGLPASQMHFWLGLPSVNHKGSDTGRQRGEYRALSLPLTPAVA